MWLNLHLFLRVHCLSSSENTQRLFELPSLYVKKQTSWSFLMVCSVRWGLVLIIFLCCPTGGMTRNPKCTMFCSACQKFHPASFTSYVKEQTQTGTFVWMWGGMWVSLYIQSVFNNYICFLLAQTHPQQCHVHWPQPSSWQCRWWW